MKSPQPTYLTPKQLAQRWRTAERAPWKKLESKGKGHWDGRGALAASHAAPDQAEGFPRQLAGGRCPSALKERWALTRLTLLGSTLNGTARC
jgi:hypothetical protein